MWIFSAAAFMVHSLGRCRLHGLCLRLSCIERQRDGEHGATAGAVVEAEAAAMALDDGAADIQPQAQAVLLGGEEAAEQLTWRPWRRCRAHGRPPHAQVLRVGHACRSRRRGAPAACPASPAGCSAPGSAAPAPAAGGRRRTLGRSAADVSARVPCASGLSGLSSASTEATTGVHRHRFQPCCAGARSCECGARSRPRAATAR